MESEAVPGLRLFCAGRLHPLRRMVTQVNVTPGFFPLVTSQNGLHRWQRGRVQVRKTRGLPPKLLGRHVSDVTHIASSQPPAKQRRAVRVRLRQRAPIPPFLRRHRHVLLEQRLLPPQAKLLQQFGDLARLVVDRAALERRDGWDGWFLLCGGLVLVSTSTSTSTTFGTDTTTSCVPPDSSR